MEHPISRDWRRRGVVETTLARASRVLLLMHMAAETELLVLAVVATISTTSQ